MLPLIPLLFALMQSSAWGPATPPASMPHIQDGCSGISMGPGGPRVLRWAGCESRYWDVVCPMSSDTCSDGRKITTVRASSVPCEVAPGQWEMVPENTACISYRGLESWAQTTSYLSYGAELDRSPWTPSRGGTVEKLPDGWRVKNDPNQDHSGMSQVLTGAASGEVWTSAYILRTSNDVFFQLWAGASQPCGGAFALNTGGAWRQFSCSTVVPSNPMAAIYPGSDVGSTPRPQYSIDVKAAWTVKSNTPGRACWGGEAPVTCAADRHTISTEGWPTESGEISVSFVSGDPTAPERRTLIAGGASSSCRLWTTPSGNLQIGNCPGWSSSLTTTTVSIEAGRSYVATIKRRDGKASIWLDGVLELEEEKPPFVWDPEVHLGTTGTTNHLDGSISSLRWRSK